VCTVCGRNIDVEEQKAKRLSVAILSNLDSWISDVETIEEIAEAGEKARSLHLLRNMMQAKQALLRLSGGS
jgi:hypothetical protein